jgi:uncharacterized membrane protein YcaP (DUF421 family)
LFRMTGKRTLGQVTTFDFILLLIVGEATQQALLGEDFSITHANLVIATLLGLERLSDYLGWRLPSFGKATESMPLILVQDGEVLQKVLKKEHLDEEDILSASRQSQGLERLDQIKWAVLETNGGISIVPKANAAPQA